VFHELQLDVFKVGIFGFFRFNDGLAVEHEVEGAVGHEFTASFVDDGADVVKGARIIVGGTFDPEKSTMGSFSLVVDLLEIASVFLGGALDSTLDVILGHVLGLGASDGGAEFRIGVRITAAFFGCHGDGTPQLRKQLGHFVPTFFFSRAARFKCSTHAQMKLLFTPLFMTLLTVMCTAKTVVEKPEWGKLFQAEGVVGTIVVADERGDPALYVYNAKRAHERYSPASTFKIAHSLFALDARLVRDEHQLILWDGKKRAIAAWNKDQTLKTAMQHSAVWVYEGFAKSLGEEKERAYLKKATYGNEDPTGKEPFWIQGNLGISAHEQIRFLKRLYAHELPFADGHQRIIKDAMLVDAGRGWTLRAKSGWTGQLAWWVGWLETHHGAVFFALNIDTPRKKKDLQTREKITQQVLASLGVRRIEQLKKDKL